MACGSRAELEQALRAGHWPAAVPQELRSHVAGCSGCRAFAATSVLMRQARVEAAASARLPSAGSVWWRAQLRKRRETMEALERPLRRAQMMGAVVSLLCALAALVWLAREGFAWPAVRMVFTAPVIVGAAVLLLLMGAAVLRAVWERD